MSLPVLAVAVAAVVAVVRAPLRHAVVVLLGVTLLLPNNMTVQGTPGWLPVARLVLWVFVGGLVLRMRRGELPAGALRPRRLHLALAAFLALAFVNGVVLTPLDNTVVDSSALWLTLADQLAILVAVLAAVRVLGLWWVARAVAVVATLTAVVAVYERWTEWSYARWWFQLADQSGPAVPAQRLSPRGGEFRVRGAFQFALEYAWVGTILLPVVIVVATRARSRLAWAAPGLLTLAIVWTVSRSTIAGIAVAAVVLVLLSRFDRRATELVVAGALVAALALLASPSLRDPFSGADPDSVPSRERRLAFATHEVADRPYTGLGLAGLRARGIQGTDAAYSQFYAALGVPGLVGFLVVMTSALGTCLLATRARDPDDRALASAAVAGVVAGGLGSAAMSLFSVPGSAKSFWIVAALGVGVLERAPAPARALVSGTRVLLPIAGIGLGMIASNAVPTHAAVHYRFETIAVRELVDSDREPLFGGRVLVNTTCDVVAAAVARVDARIDCLDPRSAAGLGELRIEADTPRALARADEAITAAVAGQVRGFRTHVLSRDVGTPTWARTAWLSGGMVGLAAAMLLPPIRPRRRARPIAPRAAPVPA